MEKVIVKRQNHFKVDTIFKFMCIFLVVIYTSFWFSPWPSVYRQILRGITYICAIVTLIKDYDDFISRLQDILLLCLGIFFVLLDHGYFILSIFLLKIFCRKLPLDSALKYMFLSQVFYMTLVMLLWATSEYAHQYDHYSPGADREYRYSLGFVNPNTAGSYLLFIIFTYYAYKRKIGPLDLGISAFSMFTVYALTISRTTLLIYFILVGALIVASFVKVNRALVWFFALSFIAFGIISVIGPFFIVGGKIDELLSHRFYYSYLALTDTWTLKEFIFGRVITFPVDNFYVSLFYEFGLIFSLIILSMYFLFVYYTNKNFDTRTRTFFMAIFVVLAFYNISETYSRNFTSFLFVIPLTCINCAKKGPLFKQVMLDGYSDRLYNLDELISQTVSLKG